MPEPSLDGAERYEVVFGGGMMGGRMMGGGMMGGGMMDGGMMGMMGRGMMSMMTGRGVWSINGVSATGHVMDPLLHLELGRPYILALHHDPARSEEHKSELQSLMRRSYAVFC